MLDAELRTKRLTVKRALKDELWEGARGAAAEIDCQHVAKTPLTIAGYANRARRCSYRARLRFGGIGFCLRHARKVAMLTGLEPDNEDASGAEPQG